jgi:hypothetical protein
MSAIVLSQARDMASIAMKRVKRRRQVDNGAS